MKVRFTGSGAGAPTCNDRHQPASPLPDSARPRCFDATPPHAGKRVTMLIIVVTFNAAGVSVGSGDESPVVTARSALRTSSLVSSLLETKPSPGADGPIFNPPPP